MAYQVVIAEDEFILAKSLQSLVEALGHQVLAIAESGQQAIDCVKEHQPDLVLMDVRLAEMDGITAARAIASQQSIPIIVISAFSDHQYIAGAAEAGVMTYLIKPVSLGDLRAVIDLTMARYRELQTLRQEVGDLKQALTNRKIVERAKGLLMDQLHLSEREAFRRLQQLSQHENRPMADIAQSVVTTCTLLQGHDASPNE